MVHEDNHKRLHWPLAVVTKLFPGNDGLVRYAELRMKGVISNRPIKKLYPLEVTATVTEAKDEHEVNAGEGHTESRTFNPTKQKPITRPVRHAATKAKDVIRNWISQLRPNPDLKSTHTQYTMHILNITLDIYYHNHTNSVLHISLAEVYMKLNV